LKVIKNGASFRKRQLIWSDAPSIISLSNQELIGYEIKKAQKFLFDYPNEFKIIE
jgi:hypothetical protein